MRIDVADAICLVIVRAKDSALVGNLVRRGPDKLLLDDYRFVSKGQLRFL